MNILHKTLIALAAISLSACIEIKSDVVVDSDGSASFTAHYNVTKMLEMAKSMSKDDPSKAPKIDCAEITKKEPEKMKGLSCKDDGTGKYSLTGKIAKGNPAIKIDGSKINIDAIALFGAVGGNNSPTSEGKAFALPKPEEALQMKQMGMLLELNLTVPGKITSVDGKAPTDLKEPNKITVDVLGQAGKANYMIVAEKSGWLSYTLYAIGGLVGLVIIVAIVGVIRRRNKKSA